MSRIGSRKTISLQFFDSIFEYEIHSEIAEFILNWMRWYFKDYLVLNKNPNSSINYRIVLRTGFDGVDHDLFLQTVGEKKSCIQRDFRAEIMTLQACELVEAYLGEEWIDGVHNLNRWLLPKVLVKNNALLLHAAGVIKSGKAHVFTGVSGAGKTTATRLIQSQDPDARIIGDDVVVLKITKTSENLDQLELHPAPFGSGYTLDPPPFLSAPVQAIYHLNQSKVIKIQTLNQPEAVFTLMANSMGIEDLKFTQERLQLVQIMVSKVTDKTQWNRLYFKKDPEFWTHIINQSHERNL